ncbi:MAG: hypothetical protein VKQ33_00350 [Candidatus Sericytochromatia bacterium]|nr:hypothetical protein [Candidatus Sericytochromatia bacterium]
MSLASIPALHLVGTPAVASAKVAHHFACHREARAEVLARALRRGRRWMMGGAAAGVVGPALAWLVEAELGWAVGGFGVLALIVGGINNLETRNQAAKTPEARPAGQALLQRLLGEFAPQARLHLHVDARSAAEATDPERTARSPHSGYTKSYHRHPWLTLKGWLADGCLLGLTFTHLQKVRLGHPMRDQTQVQGRLRLPAGSQPGALPTGLEKLHVAAVPGQPEVLFWGVLGTEVDVLPDLRRLLQAVRTGPAS